MPSIFQTFPSYYQKDIKLQRSPRKRQYVAHERKKIHNLKDLVDSLKQQKLVSDAEQHLLEQNFDGVGKYLFENQIAMQSRQANKLYVKAAGCGLVIPILTFVLTSDIHRSVYASGHYGNLVPGWLQNTILLGMGTH